MIQWDVHVARTSSIDDDGFLETQTDVEGEQASGVVPYETHHPYGFFSIPLDPVVDDSGNLDPATAHQVLVGMEGGKGHAIVLENPAIVALLPNGKKGDSFFHGPKGEFLRCTGGTIVGSCPGPEGEVDPTLSFGPEGFVVTGRWGSLKLDDNGFTVLTASGARIRLGGLGGIPAPLDAVGSEFAVDAGSIDLDAIATRIGAGSAAVPLTNAITLTAWMASVSTALNAIKTFLELPSAFVNGAGACVGNVAGLTALDVAVAPATAVPDVTTHANGTI